MLIDNITLLPNSVIIGEKDEKTLNVAGTLTLMTGTARWYPTQNIQLISVQSHVNTPPVGANILISIKKNGVVIISGVSIIPSTNSSSIVSDSTLATIGDYLTVDITQIGSSTPGSDLTVQILYKAT